MTEEKYDVPFKIIIIGDSSIGKTSLINKYCNDCFYPFHNPTIGIEFTSKIVQLDLLNKKFNIMCHFLDTAGQEIFRSLTRSYYRYATGVILCYDTTSIASFNHLEYWLQEIKKECGKIKIILIGTKFDLQIHKEVSTEQANRYAEQNGMMLYEVSSKTNTNVENAINKLVYEIYIEHNNKKIENDINAQNKIVNIENNKKQSNCNC